MHHGCFILCVGAQRPMFNRFNSRVLLNQNARVGHVVAELSCTAAGGEPPVYRLVEPVTGFQILRTSGRLVLTVDAVGIEVNNYTLVVECFVSQFNSGSQVTVTVFRRDVNEFMPMFTTDGPIVVNLSENSPINTFVTQVTAEDSDSGENGRIMYAINTTDADRFFSVNAGTGRIVLRTTLNYEDREMHQFIVTASDLSSSDSIVIIVNVLPADDTPPTFQSPSYSVQAPQNNMEASLELIDLDCTDVDTDNSRIGYGILTVPHSPFSIDSRTGQLSASSYNFDCNTTFFSLTVSCFDNSLLNGSSSAMVEIFIQLSRGSDPYVCRRLRNIHIRLTELAPLNQVILSTLSSDMNRYEICDDDCGPDGNVTYTISSDTTQVISDYFTLDPLTGALVLTRTLDFDIPDTSLSTDLLVTFPVAVKQVFFNIRGCDSFPARLSCPTVADALFMFIFPINDNMPRFSQRNYSASVLESAPFDHLVLRVMCVDADLYIGEFDSITYSNATEVVRNTFHLNTHTGEIRINLRLDHESTTGYGFHLKCNDSSGQSDFTTVTITVLGANDNDPEFPQSVYHFDVSRTTPPNSFVVGRVMAEDADIGVGGNLVYSAVPNEYFDVTSDGTIILLNSVQNVTFAGYRFDARVEDQPGLNTTRLDTATVVVTFTDGNMVRPSFITGTRALEVSELLSVGGVILNLTCIDSELGLNGLITYSIRSGNTDQAFSIDRRTGIITIQSMLTVPSGSQQIEYYLDVFCEDHGVPVLSSNAIILVRVLRDDSRPPEITSNSSSIFVDEDASLNQLVATVIATDLDTDLLQYSFQNESDPGAFLIDPQSGAILVAQTLDREQVSEYTMTVVVTERRVIPGPERSDSVYLTILVRDVNDNSPLCDTASLSVTVSDRITSGTSILTLNCSDLDIGRNGNLTYTLENDFNVLAVDGNGRIYLNGSLADVDFNRLTTSVTVSDRGTPTSLSRSYFINIHLSSTNVHRPSFNNLPNSVVLPESHAVQTVIFTVSATDEDRGSFGQLVYRIVNSSNNDAFDIIPNTGDIFLRVNLDFHEEPSYTLTISVEDSHFINVSTLTVLVMDVNEYSPVCEGNNTRWRIPETILPNLLMPFDLSCSDNDRGPSGVLTYSIESGNSGGQFGVRNDGVVIVERVLDYEQEQEYRLVVTVADGGTPAMSIDVVVLVSVDPVNEFPPVFSSDLYSVEILENSTVGTTAVVVAATDSDLSTHRDGQFAYSLNGVSPLLFTISRSGTILVSGDLDRETQAMYTFTVVASDQGAPQMSSSSTVRILLGDVDDNPPSFTMGLYVGVLNHLDSSQNLILSARCTDLDTAPYAAVVYSLDPSSPASLNFQISSTGEIRARGPISMTGLHTFRALCTGPPPLLRSDSTTIAIEVIISENITFSSSIYNISIPENAAPVFDVTRLSASSPAGISLGYRLAQPHSLFAVDGTTGWVRLLDSLDFETQQFHVLQVEAYDVNNPTNVGEAAVSITVENVNDDRPMITSSPGLLNLTEGYVSSNIYDLDCSDGDAGGFGDTVFRILQGNTPNIFSLTNSGLLRAEGNVDYESTSVFQLEIACEDGGIPALRDTITLIVNVIPQNDNPPLFAQEVYTLEVSESVTVNTVIGNIVATDGDRAPHNSLRYSILSGNTNPPSFVVQPTTGQLSLARALDYDILPRFYMLEVFVDDGGVSNADFPILNDTAIVNVNVLNANDNTPILSSGIYTGSIPETVSGAQVMLATPIACTDGDFGDTTRLSIADAAFEINSAGIVLTTRRLDYESQRLHEVEVRCTDSGTPSRSAVATLYVTVTDVNEFSPRFINASGYIFNVPESAIVGREVGRITAVDEDGGPAGVLTYRFVNDSMTPFAVTSHTGSITLLTSLDFETQIHQYTLQAIASDASNDTNEVTVIFNILDVDDNLPAFTRSMYFFSVRENAPIGSIVGQVQCTDADNTALRIPVSYAIESSPFRIGSESGTVEIESGLDLELIPRYTLRITCRDNAGNAEYVTATITLLPFNDHVPVFLQSNYTSTVTENSLPGVLVDRVQAVDDDVTDYFQVTYSIVGGNDANLFSVDPSGGEVRVNGTIDREVDAEHVLMLQAQNVILAGDISGSRPLSSVVPVIIMVLDVNDNDPTITPTNPDPVVISEAAGPMATVAHLACSDMDDGLNGTIRFFVEDSGARQRYRVLGNGTVVTSEIVRIDEVLTITCSDFGVPPRFSSVDIRVFTTSVNNYPPEFTSSDYVLSVPENFTIGETMSCITATDRDGSDTPDGVVHYSLRYLGAGESRFRIRPSDGCIVLSLMLDYDEAMSYEYEIIAADSGVPVMRGNASLTIQITNFVQDPPVFRSVLYTRSLPENVGSNFQVLQVACTDLDFGDIITYDIIGDTPHFAIDSASGVIRTTSTVLDYEVAESHTFQIFCQDSSLLRDQAEVVITVLPINEFTPYFISSTAVVAENSIPGTRVSDLEWMDNDRGQDGTVGFTIDTGNSAEAFSISPSGRVLVRGTLDRERVSFYSLNITINDRSLTDPRSSTGQLNITIQDINDNQPQFTRSTYEYGPLLGNETVGYFVGSVSCMDSDIGSNSQVSYRLSPESKNDILFSIDAISGDIFVAGNLANRESDGVAFTVLCADMGVPVLEASTRVLVRVEEINRHAPQFLNSSYSIHVPEDTEIINRLLLTVSANDADDGINGMITYSLLNTFNNLFFMDERTGALSLLRSLDFEEQSSYELTAVARDAAADSRVRLRDTASIAVSVVGVNEFIPRCHNAIYTAIINSSSQGVIVDFMCTDDDRGPDGQLEYMFLSGNELGFFTIVSGRLVIPNSFRPPSGVERFVLQVLVSDQGQVSRSVTIDAVLPFSFSNLARPVFERASYDISVSELTEVGTVVISVTARDTDSGIQGQITYSIEGSDNFRTDPNNGNVFLASALDWERAPSLSFNVVATDNDPNFPLSDSSVVNVAVINENDNTPRCDRGVYTAQVLSNASIGNLVVALNCEDLDRTSLVYTTASSNSAFRVDHASGRVTVAQGLRNLRGSTVVLDVRVSDTSEFVSVPVNIAVLFANQDPPTFQRPLYTFYILESAPALSVVGQVQAEDLDSSDSSLTFSLIRGSAGTFYLDPLSGRVILTASVDFERIQEYQLTIGVSDSGSFDGSNILSSTASVVVRINNTNDNDPIFSNGGIYGSTVPELTQVSTRVVSMSCSDADAVPFGTAHISADIPDTTPFELVVVEDRRGEIQVSGPLNGPSAFVVNVTCSDGERFVIGQVFLFVPEPLAPVFSSPSYEWFVPETAQTGSSFQSIQATSNFSAVTYSIVDGNNDGIFYIEPSTGALSLVATLDYESQQRHGLIIRALDEANRESNVLLLVQVIDVDDDLPLIPPSAQFTVRQNQLPGYPVGVVQCIDAESRVNRSILNYTFSSSTEQFSINMDGLVTLEARLGAIPVYVLPVLCFSVRDPLHNSTGIITVEVEFINQYTPVFGFSDYNFIVSEDFPSLVPLGPAVMATDRDIGSYGQLIYTILDSQDQFFMNFLNGTVESLTSLDRETQDYFNFTIAAVDGGPSALNSTRRTGTATVFVRVLDSNDNSPSLDRLSYVQTIFTNHSVGSPVLSVQCSDPDLGINGTTDFSLTPSTILEHFSIQSDGTVILNRQQPNQAIHTFSVVCTDRGVPSLTSSSLVTVIVNFVALGAPVFDSEQYNATITEDTGVTTSILTVHATPSDASISVVYEIVGGNNNDSFFLNSETGVLSVRNPLDARQQQNYTLSIRAGNFGSDQLYSLSTASIYVKDINDNSPSFVVQLYTARTSENASVPTPVLIVECSDSDLNSDIMYSLSGESPYLFSFSINERGVVFVSGMLDYEIARTVSLEVRCEDAVEDPRSATALIRIDISPVNEFTPQFSQDQYFFQATENDFGAFIGRVSASDGDSGVDGSLTYLLQDPGNFSVIFVDPTDGGVFISDNLDYEVQPSWNLTVIARDGRGLESIAYLNIEVINVNDENPTMFPAVAVTTVDVDSHQGFPIQSYVCSDPDGFSTSISISNGNSEGYFSIDVNNILVWTGQASGLLSDTIVSLILQCQDLNDLTQSAESIIAISINVTNSPPPLFSDNSYSVFLNENATVDSIVHFVQATAQNGTVVYSIVSSPVGFPFVINFTDGSITLVRPLNRETESFYSFFVSAMDTFTLGVSVALVEVTVLDINDNPPEITPSMQSIRLSENYSVFSAPISFFTCVDNDAGPNSDISFQITGGDSTGIFTVNNNGQVFLSQAIDFETTSDYTLEITCSDSLVSPLTDTATLFVQISSFNEHPPVFSMAPYLFFTGEVTPVGTVVGSVRAQDPDGGVDGAVTYSIITPSDFFAVGDSSGNITISRSLDFEQQSQHQFSVLARDNAEDIALRMSATVTVVVQVEEANEHTPSCVNVIYQAVINATSQGRILNFFCSDRDGGQSGELQYSIVQGNNRYFTVMSDSLFIPAAFTPAEETGEFRLSILVSDSGIPSRNVTIEVVLFYSYENLASPQFNRSIYYVEVEERTQVGTVVLMVLATDSDPSIQGLVTYSVERSNHFRVDPSNGNVFLASPLDWETMPSLQFRVIAQDSDPYSPLSGLALVNVTVINNNDNSPQCDRTVYTAQILSNVSAGHTVISLNCSDLDRNGLTYSIITDNLSSFRIGSSSGEVTVAGPLMPSFTYSFDIRVSGEGDEHINISASIAVRFANQESPRFSQDAYDFFVSESTGTLANIGQVQAMDGDPVPTILTYSLISGNTNRFYVHPTTGDLVLTMPLDFEMSAQYSLTVQATDDGSYDGSNVLHGSASVNIHVINSNDIEPVFQDGNIYGRTLPEVTPIGTTIVTLTCTDGDALPFGNPVVSGNLSGIPFQLTQVSRGVSQIIVSMPLSGEEAYFINVTCNDGPEQEIRGQVYIFIPEPQAPNFTRSSYDWYVSELTDTNAFFSEVQASSDDGSVIVYSIIDGNADDIFTINQSSGVLSLMKSLDFEDQSQHGLLIQAVDGQGRRSNVLLLVHVINANDEVPLVPPSALFSVRQNELPGYPLGYVQCVDADDRMNFTVFNYSFNSPSNQFSIDRFGVIRLEAVLDETPVYVLPVTCFDVVNPQHNSTGIVTVEVQFINQYSPIFQFSSYDFSVQENYPALAALGPPPVATDRDIGSYGQLAYSILDDENQFFIDPVTGSISSLTPLDRETQSLYTLTAIAVDGGPSALNSTRRTGTATVFVRVLDSNDNSPSLDRLSYVQTIFTNHSVGSPVLSVQCSDPDLGINGTTDFSLTPSTILEHFSIQSDGTVILNRQQPNQAIHTFSVVCTDRGVPSLTSSSLVTVIVNFVALGAPVFDSEQYNATITEDTGVTTSILTVHATPSDASISVVYEIVGGNNNDSFFLNSETGVLSVRNPLDARQQQNYVISVSAGNEGSNQLFSLTTITIFVEDINDNRPSFEFQFYTDMVLENASLATPVLTVRCTDADLNSDISYSISSVSTDAQNFNITSEGTVYVAGALDYETETAHSLEVICSDGGESPQTARATLRVEILPVNEFRPTFLQGAYYFEAAENDFGAIVGSVRATDEDRSLHGAITYQLFDPENTSVVFVEPVTGLVRVSSNLDYEAQRFWNLSVLAVDGGGLESLALLNIQVININDESPILLPPTAAHSIAVDEVLGTPLQAYSCTDADGSDTTTSIVDGNSAGFFGLENGVVVWAGNNQNVSRNLVVSLTLQCFDSQDPSQVDESVLAVSIVVTDSIPPVFSESPYRVSIPEDAMTNSTVVVVSAVGENEPLVYSFVNVPFGFPFSIDSLSGNISLSGSLNSEVVSSFSFVVLATDPIAESVGLVFVEVSVLDVNDNPPVVSPSVQIVRLPEDFTPGRLITMFFCTDEDSGNHTSINFGFVSGNDQQKFTVTRNGAVYLSQSLDFESTGNFSLVLFCSDGSENPLRDTAILNVIVEGINEYIPSFSNMSYSFAISEYAGAGDLVGTVVASDLDGGLDGQVLYSTLSGSGQDYFTISDMGGLIRTSVLPLNATAFPVLQLNVRATDGGSLHGDAIVLIRVEDVNEPPLFSDMGTYFIRTSTSVLPGDTIFSFTCYDTDTGDNSAVDIEITMLPPLLDLYLFTVARRGARDAHLRPNATLPAGSFELTVTCSDSGSPSISSSTSLTLRVESFNTAPVFTQNIVSPVIEETIAIGSTIFTVSAEDAQTGVVYSIAGGTGRGTFQVGRETGAVSVVLPLDYETVLEYTLNISVTDLSPSNPLSATMEVQIIVTNVNDEYPVLTPAVEQTITLQESSPPMTHVASYTCSDRDMTAVTISISSQDTPFPFSVSSTGDVTLVGTLDYEVRTSHTIAVTCSDREVRQGEGTVLQTTQNLRVVVSPENLHAPVFTSELTFNVSESTPIGSIIASLEASDSDNRSVVTFRSQNPGEFLVSQNGSIQLLFSLDFEEVGTHVLTVIATDNDNEMNLVQPRTTSAVVTINVLDYNDNPPVCASNALFVSFNTGEYGSSGRSLLHLNCSDRDSGDNAVLTYSLEGTLPNIPDGNFFINNVTSEMLFLGSIEASGSLILQVLVEDLGLPTLQTTVDVAVQIIDTNATRPRFNVTLFIVEISEHELSPSVILRGEMIREQFINPDNYTVEYSLRPSIEYNGIFIIDLLTADLSLTDNDLLDYDTGRQQYILTLQATVNLVVETTFIEVNIEDFNDNAPRFERTLYTPVISENQPRGTHILTVNATDADSEQNAMFTYSIAGGDFPFSIDPSSGNITTVIPFDREISDRYTVFVLATDFGRPRLTGTATVNVLIGDENDEAPFFIENLYVVNIHNAVQPGERIVTVNAEDEDMVGTLTFQINDEDAREVFLIDSSGTVRVRSTGLPRDHPSRYNFTVEVSDGIQTDLATVVIYTVSVTSDIVLFAENDLDQMYDAQAFLSKTFNLSSDATYDIFKGDLFDTFEISSDGILSLTMPLDRENISRYDLGIRVIDVDNIDLEVAVIVQDQNDNSPEFSADFYRFNISEGHYNDEVAIGFVIATDDDEPGRGASTIEYSIITPVEGIGIRPHTGELFVKDGAILDREKVSNLSFAVQARDFGEPQSLSTTVPVGITLDDINDNDPEFVPLATLEFQVLLLDDDIGPNTRLDKIRLFLENFENDVEIITVADPDLVGTVTASIEGLTGTKTKFAFRNPNAANLELITTDYITKEDFGTTLNIVLRDQPVDEEDNPVIRNITFVGPGIFGVTTQGLATDSPDFFETEAGIAVLVVICLLITVVAFGLFCLVCCIRIRREKDPLNEG